MTQKRRKKRQKTTKKHKKRSKKYLLRKAGALKSSPEQEYLDIMNQSVKSILRVDENVFTKNDLGLLLGIESTTKEAKEMKEGDKGVILKAIMNSLASQRDKSFTVDPGCNSMCLTVSLISWSILGKRFDQLSKQEKLFLFCIHYLSKEEELENVILPEVYAIRKLNIEMEAIERYHQHKVDQGASPRLIKRALKNVEKARKKKDDILSNYKPGHQGTNQLYVDICDEIDCGFINKGEMYTPELADSILKLCKYLVIMFKGLLTHNLEAINSEKGKYINKIACHNKACQGNGKTFATNELLEKHMTQEHNETNDLRMYVNFDIKEILFETGAVIMPSFDCYIHSKDSDGFIEEWVYLCDSSSRTIKKVLLSELITDGYYLCAVLDMDFIAGLAEKESAKPTNMGEYINRIIQGYALDTNSVDTLSYIEIGNKKLGNGTVVSNINEVFEGATSDLIEHWFVSSTINIENECIEMSLDASDASDY